jgi:hypothetical protein
VVNSTTWLLYPQESDPVSILQEAGWTPGPVWTGAENLTLTGIRSPDRPACSEKLYPPHYTILAHHQTLTTKTNHLLYRKAVAFYYENHVKHINTLSGRRVGVQGLWFQSKWCVQLPLCVRRLKYRALFWAILFFLWCITYKNITVNCGIYIVTSSVPAVNEHKAVYMYGTRLPDCMASRHKRPQCRYKEHISRNCVWDWSTPFHFHHYILWQQLTEILQKWPAFLRLCYAVSLHEILYWWLSSVLKVEALKDLLLWSTSVFCLLSKKF